MNREERAITDGMRTLRREERVQEGGRDGLRGFDTIRAAARQERRGERAGIRNEYLAAIHDDNRTKTQEDTREDQSLVVVVTVATAGAVGLLALQTRHEH